MKELLAAEVLRFANAVMWPHEMWFRLDGDTLGVVRVLHSSRDAGRWV